MQTKPKKENKTHFKTTDAGKGRETAKRVTIDHGFIPAMSGGMLLVDTRHGEKRLNI